MKEKSTAKNFVISFFDQKLQFTYPEASRKDVQATREVLKREHPALQKMKCINFFLFLWVIFALLDSDPVCESGSGSRDLIESGSTALLLHTTVLKKQCFGSGSRQAICPQKRNKFHI
jgi:hypothetical protein